MTAAMCVFSFLVILFVSHSARLGRAYLNGPIIFLVAGGVVGRTLADAEAGIAGIRTIAEVAAALAPTDAGLGAPYHLAYDASHDVGEAEPLNAGETAGGHALCMSASLVGAGRSGASEGTFGRSPGLFRTDRCS
jgi:hypothetical protein